MYAEIKNNSQILINRLSNTESILLKDIADRAKEGEITFDNITGETGDFDGILINIKDKEETK